MQTIKTDAVEFFYALEQDGFIVSGKSQEECEANNQNFLSSPSNNVFIKNNFQAVAKQENSPQDFFEKYLDGEPQLTNLHIEITSKCNERCIHCYIPHENKTTHMWIGVGFSWTRK